MARRTLARLLPSALLAAAILASSAPAPAGPVPGVETFDRKPVDFPVPPSLVVWDIGSDEYLVTFRWKPDQAVEHAGVAGTFNAWNRADLPMEGPDADGWLSVTAKLKAGEHEYKFVEGTNGWHTDPLNVDPAKGVGENSKFALGFFAIMGDVKVASGDGQVEMRAVMHDPAQAIYFDQTTATEAFVRLRAMRGDVEGATLRIDVNGAANEVPMRVAGGDATFDYFEARVESGVGAGARYSFALQDGAEVHAIEGSWPLEFSAERIVDVPEWAKHAVWYQIMVDRFRDGDPTNNPEHHVDGRPSRITHPWNSAWYDEKDWERDATGRNFWRWAMYDRLYGGDFQGVIDKLDYLQGLGVTAIYLNPVFQASNSHKYNARSYVHADDMYGKPGEHDRVAPQEDYNDPATWAMNESDKAMVRLIEECHARGMRIILDGVWNHVGDDHLAFLDVKKNGRASRYADWFDVKSWEPFQYSGWAGHDALPEFKKSETGFASEQVKNHIFNVTRRWMDPNGDGDTRDGIDGWRLDVPMHVPHPFWVEWRDLVKSINPEAYIVGEIWSPAEEWLDGTTFDAVMNYQVPKIAFQWFANRAKKIPASEFDRQLARLRLRYPRNHTLVLQNLFDSHDTDRWVSRIANPDMDYDTGNRLQDDGKNYMDERPSDADFQRLRLMALFQATYVGAPMIWYGTEVGMFGADDPMCRMPMWWEDLGPYDNPEYRVLADQREHFRELFALRNGAVELRTGEFTTAVVDDARDVYGYWRHAEDSPRSLLVLLNNSGTPHTVGVPVPDASVAPRGFRDVALLLGSAGIAMSEDGTHLEATLAPVSGAVFQVLK